MRSFDGYLSQLVGRPVTVQGEDARRPIGKVADFLVRKPDDAFPQIDGIVFKTGIGRRYSPISAVVDIDPKGLVTLSGVPIEVPIAGDQALYLIEDLFDKQIVDVNGRKVVRINDLEVATAGGALRVVAADIGASGLLQRLGAGWLLPKLGRRLASSLIAWDNVAPIADVNPVNVKLAVAENRLSRLHPSELAEIIGDLSALDAARIVQSLDDETAADAFEHLDADVQQSIIEDVGVARAAAIIAEMDSDAAADLLGELDEDQREELLAKMEDRAYADELSGLVEYEDDTAGGLMTTDYVWVYPQRTTAATIEKIREISPESEFIYYLYVTDDARKLLGVLSLRTLLLAPPTAFISRLMETDVVSVSVETSAKDVAATIARYDLLAVPVLDDDGRILGIVTVDDAIDTIIPDKIANSLPRLVRHEARGTADAAR